MSTNSTLQSQERVAGTLAYVFFLIPMIMKVKTDYTMFHAKQSFVMILVIILMSFIPFFAPLFLFMMTILMLWCMYRAYSGDRYPVPVIADNMDMLISGIGLTQFFSSK